MDALNQSGVNALLKTIEEPPAGTYLILISERFQSLPATLRSRCQNIRFAPPTAALSIEWMGHDAKTANAALEQAHGAPLLAQEMIKDGHIARRQTWAAEMDAIAGLKRDPLAAASEIGKESATEFMEWLLLWLTAQLRLQIQGQGASLKTLKFESLFREAIKARAQLTQNGQPQLLVESVLILWWHLNLTGNPR